MCPMRVIQIHVLSTLFLLGCVVIGHDYVGTLTIHDVTILTLIVIVLYGMVTGVLLWREVQEVWHYQEYVRICAWCRKIGVKDKWISIEDWIDSELERKTTHGICEDCKDKQLRGMSLSRDPLWGCENCVQPHQDSCTKTLQH